MSSCLKAPDPYTRFLCTIRFREKVMGGYPASKELIEPWIKARTGHDDDQTKEQVTAAEQAIADQEKLEATWTVFPKDAKGIYLETRAIKAGLRECFSVGRIFTAKVGSKQIFQHAFLVDGIDHQDRLYLRRNGSVLNQADGFIERPIHVMTAQGPRSALKRADYAEQVEFTCEIRFLKTDPKDKRHIGRKELEAALLLLQDDGLGADRSQGFGRFDVTELEDA